MKEQFNRGAVVKDITEKNYYFFMRTLEQSAVDLKNQSFTEERFRYACIMEDMAGLISSDHIACFLRYHAALLRDNLHDHITKEDLALVKKFWNDAYHEYTKIEYIDLPLMSRNQYSDYENSNKDF